MPFTPQSVSPFAPIGVAAAVQPSSQSRPKIFDEFALTGKVAIVTGGNSGIGLEMALALCEAGARSVYCLDIASTPSKEWESAGTFVQGMKNASNLEYICIDVTQQEEVWSVVGRIGDKEGRIDVCIASAGIVHAAVSSLEITGDQFKKVGGFALAVFHPELILVYIGARRRRQRCFLYCSSCWPTNDQVQV